MNRKSFLLAGLAGLGLPALAAGKPRIAMISKGFQHQFWQAVKRGAEQAAKDFQVELSFEGPESEAMVDRQIDMLAAALARRPQAIAFAALDSKAAIPLLNKAKAAKIPVIAFDSGVDSEVPLTTASTDNRAAAALAADKLAQLLGGPAEVAVLAHDQTSRTGVARRDGFIDRLRQAHPAVRVVAVQYGGGDHLTSTEVTKSLLQAHPQLKGLFCTNEGSAVGAVLGLRETKRKLVVVGFDSGKQQIDAIRQGRIAGAITQNPVGIGYRTVEAAVKALRGEALPKQIDTGFFWVDQSNLNDPRIAASLYQ